MAGSLVGINKLVLIMFLQGNGQNKTPSRTGYAGCWSRYHLTESMILSTACRCYKTISLHFILERTRSGGTENTHTNAAWNTQGLRHYQGGRVLSESLADPEMDFGKVPDKPSCLTRLKACWHVTKKGWKGCKTLSALSYMTGQSSEGGCLALCVTKQRHTSAMMD